MQTPPRTKDTSAEEPARAPGEPWLEDLGELPPRPRRRLLSPAPLALTAVLIATCGFIGGVLVEKGQAGSSSGGGPSGTFASRLGLLAGGASSGRTGLLGAGSAAGPNASGGARLTSGTVSFVAGGTLYVTDAEGDTVKVRTSSATTVTKTVKATVRSIRPGEAVTVTGAAAADGTVRAETLRVGSTGGLASLFGGASGAGSNGGSAATPPLFGG